jgi:coatomer subunit gamma
LGSGYLNFGSSGNSDSGYQPIPSTSHITQYHALGLLYSIRQQVKNFMALCMLTIRYAAKVMEEDPKYVFGRVMKPTL